MPNGQLCRLPVSELNKKTGEVVHRVMRGERFIVCRHGRPVATLQPLNGRVVQPLDGTQCDVTGSPLGDASAEVDKLTCAQHALLLDGISLGRIVFSRLYHDHRSDELGAGLEDLVLRGLVRRSDRGTILTGRGMVLREELFLRHGRGDCDWVK